MGTPSDFDPSQKKKKPRKKVICNRIYLNSSLDLDQLEGFVNKFIESEEQKHSSFEVVQILYQTDPLRRYQDDRRKHEHDVKHSVCVHYRFCKYVTKEDDNE